MRIVSGKFRGKVIKAPNSLPVRPTTDYGKEALFNILNNHYYLDDISALDLFSGIGSISLEFASRGCEDVTAVDAHKGCAGFVEKTVAEMGLEDQVTVHRMDALMFIEKAASTYDVVFADPPYDFDKYDDLVAAVFENKILKEEGILVVEHDFRNNFEDHENCYDTRKYGNVNYSFFNA